MYFEYFKNTKYMKICIFDIKYKCIENTYFKNLYFWYCPSRTSVSPWIDRLYRSFTWKISNLTNILFFRPVQVKSASAEFDCQELADHLATCLNHLRRMTDLSADVAAFTSAPLQTRNLVTKVRDVTAVFKVGLCIFFFGFTFNVPRDSTI